mmetsp:Transcript_1249/g.3859  ORF Transcript_1249/g.3859 Transcript_1249/m.3859 type:complete len:116 (-) Transcript_1249:745-1092(-)
MSENTAQKGRTRTVQAWEQLLSCLVLDALAASARPGGAGRRGDATAARSVLPRNLSKQASTCMQCNAHHHPPRRHHITAQLASPPFAPAAAAAFKTVLRSVGGSSWNKSCIRTLM